MLEKQILRHIGLRARVNWRDQGNALIEEPLVHVPGGWSANRTLLS